MSNEARIVLGAWLLGVAIVGFVGCGPKTASTPPRSDAVTTQPLDIEMPSQEKGTPAGEKSGEAKKTPTAEPVPEAPKL